MTRQTLNMTVRFIGAIVLLLSYGYRINRDGEDTLLSESFEAVERFARDSLPGSFLVDVIPARKK